MNNPSSPDSKLFRIYTVSSDNKTSRQYLTDLENQLKDYPFRGYLVSYGNPFSGTRALKVGEVVQVSDAQGKKIRTGFPIPVKVLDVSEVSESEVSSIYRPSGVRLYCLDREQGRCVVATNNENLIYSLKTTTTRPQHFKHTPTGETQTLLHPTGRNKNPGSP